MKRYEMIDEMYNLKSELIKLVGTKELRIADALIKEVEEIAVEIGGETEPIIRQLLDDMTYDYKDYGDTVNRDFAIELDDDGFDYRDHLTNARNLWVFREIKMAVEATEEDMEI